MCASCEGDHFPECGGLYLLLWTVSLECMLWWFLLTAGTDWRGTAFLNSLPSPEWHWNTRGLAGNSRPGTCFWKELRAILWSVSLSLIFFPANLQSGNHVTFCFADSVNILTADGVKFSHPLYHLGKTSNDLPVVAIDSFRHMYLWKHNPREDLRWLLCQYWTISTCVTYTLLLVFHAENLDSSSSLWLISTRVNCIGSSITVLIRLKLLPKAAQKRYELPFLWFVSQISV